MPGRTPVQGPAPASPHEAGDPAGLRGPLPPDGGSPRTEGYARHSHGLEQFLNHLHSQEPLSVLDVGGANQANVEFLTGLGHKLLSEDFLRVLDATAAAGPSGGAEAGGEQEQVDSFLEQCLDFPVECVDGVLLWDSLEYLPPPLLKAAVDRLYYVTRPGAYLLAFFHADEKAAEVPAYKYRIHDARTLMLTQERMRRPCQIFNNRSVEKLFRRFQSVKFFLARDHLREVIVRR
ncbi:MAG: hypothetical protein IT159_14175 [Bryobacterales bacterium]|nr:hypothetical protein [Bryobacterales bacterium]